MEPVVPQSKIKPGVFQGTPEGVQEKNEDSSAPRVIRTMKSDTREVIKKQNETFVSIALAEERKLARQRDEALAIKKTQFENTPPPPKRISRLVIVIILLFIVSLSVLAYFFVLPKLSSIQIPGVPLPSFEKEPSADPVTTEPKVEPLAPSMIPAQAEKHFDISLETIAQVATSITSEKGQGVPAGSIKNFYFKQPSETTPVEISSNRLIIFTGVQVPVLLTRSLEKPFMAGFFGEANGGATPFLILKVSDHDTGLAGMLMWETNLPRFFDTLFGTNIESGVMITTKFNDILISGKDARTLDTPSSGSIVYSFANKEIIVIAGSRTALEALLPLAAKN